MNSFLTARSSKRSKEQLCRLIINFLCTVCSNLRVFHHLMIQNKSRHVLEYFIMFLQTSLNMFQNCIKSHQSTRTVLRQVTTCLESYQIKSDYSNSFKTSLNMFKNRIKSHQSIPTVSRQVLTCFRIVSNHIRVFQHF